MWTPVKEVGGEVGRGPGMIHTYIHTYACIQIIYIYVYIYTHLSSVYGNYAYDNVFQKLHHYDGQHLGCGYLVSENNSSAMLTCWALSCALKDFQPMTLLIYSSKLTVSYAEDKTNILPSQSEPLR